MYVSATVTAAVTAIVVPGIRQLALQVGIVDRPAARKFHTATTPYLGGVAIAGGLLVAHLLTDSLSTAEWRLLLLALVVALVGLWDDLWPLEWRPKLAIEAAMAAAAAALIWLAVPEAGRTAALATACVLAFPAILLLTNSVNLLDNMDGHSSSVVLASNIGTATAASWLGSSTDSLAVLSLSLAAACAVFLMFNMSDRMKIFLGDSGSLMLGFLTTATAAAALAGQPVVEYILAMAAILMMPALDTLTVVIDRRRNGLSIFTPGKDHLSHRFLQKGLSISQVVAVLAGIQLVSALCGAYLAAGTSPLRWFALIPPLVLGSYVLNAGLRTRDLYESADALASRH